MLYLMLIAWLEWATLGTVNRVSRNNQARQDAQAAYQAGRYEQALVLYQHLNRTAVPAEPAIRLDLGHTYFRLGQYGQARAQYETLLRTDRPELRTVATTQLGVIACVQRDTAAALRWFEQALLDDYTNEPARYNFELIKKQYHGTPPAPTTRPKAARRPRPTGRQVERSARQDDVLRRFSSLNMTEEQALQLLDAMQDNDLPYALTQAAQARRPPAKPTPGGPRW